LDGSGFRLTDDAGRKVSGYYDRRKTRRDAVHALLGEHLGVPVNVSPRLVLLERDPDCLPVACSAGAAGVAAPVSEDNRRRPLQKFLARAFYGLAAAEFFIASLIITSTALR
jgi:hypothetical protein